MKFINNLFGKHNPSETEILNSGLSFTMEFGKDWLQPINERLALNFSFLNSIELNKYNAICKNVIDDGQDFVFKMLENLEQNNQSITEKELKQKFKDFILRKYNWVSEENISHHFSQICYYAYKDGLDNVIKS